MEPVMNKILATLCLILAWAITGVAHHSFAAEFDGNKVQTIKGTVTDFQWMNPHAYIYLDVTDASGKKINWGVQSRNLSILKRQGLSRQTFKVGDIITIELYHHKDPAKNIGFAMYVTKADGKKFDLRPGGGVGIIDNP
jgi:hypothetical protein